MLDGQCRLARERTSDVVCLEVQLYTGACLHLLHTVCMSIRSLHTFLLDVVEVKTCLLFSI